VPVRVTVVGCSGSLPAPDSPASCYLVEADGEDGRPYRVLLDLGSGAVGPLQRFVALDEIDAILLSHLHPDHCADLSGLYVALRYAPGGPAVHRIPVHGPAGTLQRITDAYGADASGKPEQVYDVRELTDGEQLRFGPLTVTAREVLHTGEAFGFRLEADGRAVAYSGDTDACPALVELASGTDLFLCEASFLEGRDEARGIHLTARRAGETAAQAGVGRLMLTHLPVWNSPEAVTAEAAAAFGGTVELARAGQTVQL
jgi:ribonuclease BN (tRNA processing enzyme)